MIPVIIMGGVLTGWFTPTEAGMVASVYARQRLEADVDGRNHRCQSRRRWPLGATRRRAAMPPEVLRRRSPR